VQRPALAHSTSLLEQITEDAAAVEYRAKGRKALTSRKGHERRRTGKHKGESYTDKLQEKLASKAHRKDRVNQLKRLP
jgi:hypothetical protein